MNESDTPAKVGSSEGLGLLPEPAGFRTRHRSEPEMIGHYPWTYADQRRRGTERPTTETEDLYTAAQVRALQAAERERCIAACTDVMNAYGGDPAGRLLSSERVRMQHQLQASGAAQCIDRIKA